MRSAAAPTNSFFRRFAGEPFKPVGPEGTVEMDTARPFVGKHSPRIKLDGSEPRGIQQSKLRVAGGQVLSKAASIWPAIPAQRLSSGWCGAPGTSDSQTITIPPLSQRVPEVPAEVHCRGRHRGCAAGDSGHRQRHLSRRDRFADARRQRAGISCRNDQALQRSGLQDVQVAGRQLCLRLRLARRAGRPRQAAAAPATDVVRQSGVERCRPA